VFHITYHAHCAFNEACSPQVIEHKLRVNELLKIKMQASKHTYLEYEELLGLARADVNCVLSGSTTRREAGGESGKIAFGVGGGSSRGGGEAARRGGEAARRGGEAGRAGGEAARAGGAAGASALCATVAKHGAGISISFILAHVFCFEILTWLSLNGNTPTR
jgi:hypothetical protein